MLHSEGRIGGALEAVIWIVPVAIVALLTVMICIYSRNPDPWRADLARPPSVEVVVLSSAFFDGVCP